MLRGNCQLVIARVDRKRGAPKRRPVGPRNALYDNTQTLQQKARLIGTRVPDHMPVQTCGHIRSHITGKRGR